MPVTDSPTAWHDTLLAMRVAAAGLHWVVMQHNISWQITREIEVNLIRESSVDLPEPHGGIFMQEFENPMGYTAIYGQRVVVFEMSAKGELLGFDIILTNHTLGQQLGFKDSEKDKGVQRL